MCITDSKAKRTYFRNTSFFTVLELNFTRKQNEKINGGEFVTKTFCP